MLQTGNFYFKLHTDAKLSFAPPAIQNQKAVKSEIEKKIENVKTTRSIKMKMASFETKICQENIM